MPKTFIPFDVHCEMRSYAKEKFDPRPLRIRLLDNDPSVEIDTEEYSVKMSVPMALDLIKQLTIAVQVACERRDVREALLTTDPTECDRLAGRTLR